MNHPFPSADESSPSPDSAPAPFLKQICCRVAPSDRRAFSHGQRAWRGLAGCPGFRGQTGGWSLDEADFAVILGLWQDQPAMDGFMAQRHDALYEASGQRSLIQTTEVSVWRRVGLPGARSPLVEVAGREGGYLRIAEILLLPGRAEHLVEVQRTIWDPAMEAAGVLAGGLWESPDDDSRFLSISLWRSRESEREWRSRPFFDCWRRAGVEDDCEDVIGRLVSVDPDWRVDWSRS